MQKARASGAGERDIVYPDICPSERRHHGGEIPCQRGLRLERQDRAAPTRGTAEPEEVRALVGADVGDAVASPDQLARRRDLRALVAQPRAPRAIQKA